MELQYGFELAVCAIATMAVLIALHVGLWDRPWRAAPPFTYVIGVGTLGAGWTVWAVWTNQLMVAVAWWGFVAIAGTPVAIAYWVRHVLAERDHDAFTAGQLSAPLTQDAIDRGGRHATKS